MSTEAMVRIEHGHAVGLTAHDAETLADLEGGEYRCVLTTPRGRSVSQLGVFWAFCGNIADNYAGGVTKDAVAAILKIEAGHCSVLKLADGTWVRTPRSIAFNKLSQEQFSAFMDKALDAAGQCFGHDLAAAALSEALKLSTARAEGVPNKAPSEAVG